MTASHRAGAALRVNGDVFPFQNLGLLLVTATAADNCAGNRGGLLM